MNILLQSLQKSVLLISQVKLEKDQQKLRPKSAKGKAASGPPSTAPQLDREGSAEQPSTSGRASSPVAGWTTEQRAALQRAFLTVQPSQRNFWQHVAKQVPGKTALECCNCKFDELPTPVEKVKQTSRLMPSRESSPIQPPVLKLAGGQPPFCAVPDIDHSLAYLLFRHSVVCDWAGCTATSLPAMICILFTCCKLHSLYTLFCWKLCATSSCCPLKGIMFLTCTHT